MGGDKFAVLGERPRGKEELTSERTLEDLMDSIGDWRGRDPSEQFLVVEYQRSGYIELARADSVTELKRKMRHKVGI